jgi:hypothetical protein
MLPAALVGGALAIVLLAFAVGRGTSGGSSPKRTGDARAAATRPAAPSSPATPAAPAPASTAWQTPLRLQIESQPAGARIVFDGQATSQVTPSAVKVTGAGPHRVRLSKPGFVTQEIALTDEKPGAGCGECDVGRRGGGCRRGLIDSSYPVEIVSGSQTVARAASRIG